MNNINKYRYIYKLYNIILLSQLKLYDITELPDAISDEQSLSIVTLEIGEVPSELGNGIKIANWIEANASECIYQVPDGTRFIVRSGTSIVVDTDDDETSLRARDYIVGLGLPTLAHQRSLIPLHVSMVDTPYGIWAFTGSSGAGKSTTAIAISKKMGWKLLCDDLATLNHKSPDGNFYFGVNKIKLWADAAGFFGIDTNILRNDPVRSNKYHVSVNPVDPVPIERLDSIIKLSWTDRQNSIIDLRPSATFQVLMNCIHLPYFVTIVQNLPYVQSSMIQLSRKVRGFEYSRDKEEFDINKSIETIVQHLTAKGSLQ
jgi:hypothetical protein